MKFFIDTANLSQIREAKGLGILDGVTTNPSLMAKEGIKGNDGILKHYVDICNIVEVGDVSAEVISTDFDGMMKEAKMLSELHSNIVVKVPMTREGIKTIAHLSAEGIRTNCTLVFSAGQALIAAKAGASYVSPFIGRLDDNSTDGLQLIEQIAEIYNVQYFDTEILAASLRHSMHIVKCAQLGAHAITAPLNAIMGLLNHPLTDLGLQKFLSDYQKSQQ